MLKRHNSETILYKKQEIDTIFPSVNNAIPHKKEDFEYSLYRIFFGYCDSLTLDREINEFKQDTKKSETQSRITKNFISCSKYKETGHKINFESTKILANIGQTAKRTIEEAMELVKSHK